MSSKSVKILIVEDSPTQAVNLRYCLEEEGFLVDWVKNGREAEEFLEKERPDIIVSDVVMPEMDGFELCSRIKSNEVLRDITVILLTALSSPEDVIRGIESGADNFLIKPLDDELLISLIHNSLLNRGLHRDSTGEPGIEISFRGKQYFIKAGRFQVLSLLISLFENTLQKTRHLEIANRDLELSRQQLEKTLREKELLMREIHHRVKNNLALVSSLLSVQATRSGSPEVKTYAQEAEGRIRTMSMIHEAIYTTESFSQVRVDSYINKLIDKIFSTFSSSEQEIKLNVSSDNFYLEIDRLIPLALILNELLSNSFKYAFPGGREGEITLQLRKKGEEIHLLVSDNGVGFPGDLESRSAKSFGLTLVELFTKQLSGEVNTESQPGKGVTWTFKLPLPQVGKRKG